MYKRQDPDHPFFDQTGFSYPPGFPKGDSRYTSRKVIVARGYYRADDPPVHPDPTDYDGHGTGTSGIIAGNMNTTAVITSTFNEITATVSGVAPAAQLMNYQLFYTSVSGSQSAWAPEILAAIEDMIADGADVSNNSWGGVENLNPTVDPIGIAFQNAVDAGITVVKSAGNSGPAYHSLGDAMPQSLIIVGGNDFGRRIGGSASVTGPGTVPEELTNMLAVEADFTPPLTGVLTGTYVYVGRTDPANFEGCDPFDEATATAVAGNIALISRGACRFDTKVQNAYDAGAIAVIVFNNQPGALPIVMAGEPRDIPAVMIGNKQGLAMADWEIANPATSTVMIDPALTYIPDAALPDTMFQSSSRGPDLAQEIGVDVIAPGDAVWTSYSPTGGWNTVGGTSFSGPFAAGGAAVLKAMHPTWEPWAIKSAMMATAKNDGIYKDYDHTIPAGVLDMGAGRLQFDHMVDPGLVFDDPSLSFKQMRAGTSKTLTVTATDVFERPADTPFVYTLTISETGDITTTANFNLSVSPSTLTFNDDGDTATFEVTMEIPADATPGDYEGWVWLRHDSHELHLPVWVRVRPEAAENHVLILDDDLSPFGFPDYLSHYTDALDSLGYTYDVWDVGLQWYFTGSGFPTVAEMQAYDAIIWFTGDSYYPYYEIGATLQDRNNLYDVMRSGGAKVLATGMDLSGYELADNPDDQYLLRVGMAASFLQEDAYAPALTVSPNPAVEGTSDIAAFEGMVFDLGGLVITPTIETGAGNQVYVDELEPLTDEYGGKGFLRSLEPGSMGEGWVGILRSVGPTLENEGVLPGPDYRTAYLSFGLEGINNTTGYNTREELLGQILACLNDEVAVTLEPATGMINDLITLSAEVTSSVGAEGVRYRWDFGDGSDIATTDAPSAAHVYRDGGTYTVRVEVTDECGNTAIDDATVSITGSKIYLPLLAKSYTYIPPVSFTILHTNDFHGHLESDYKGRGGSAYMAGVINDIRDEVGEENVLLVDAGDVYLGAAPISQLLLGESAIDIYNMLEYDVACYGNHEFDKGQTVLISRTLQSEFPWISANIVLEGTEWEHPTWTEPYVILDKGGVDIGILGLTTDETPLVTLKGTTEGLVFKDPTETVLHYYDEVKAQSDAMIVLFHMGTQDSGPYKGMKTVAQELIDAGKPVDLIIGGHQHEPLYEPVTVGDTAIIEAGYYGRWLGRADVTVDPSTKSLTIDHYELITINNTLTPDPDVEARVQYWADQVAPIIEEPIGYTNIDLVRDYNAESIMGDLVTDGMLWKADQYDDGEVNGSVDIAFTNPGGLRADITIPEGATLPYTITWGDTFNVMPFGNTLYLMDLTGAQIQELLDQAATLYKGILQTSGATWKWYNDCQCDTPTTWGAYDVMVNGEPLDPEETYRVVTNNFLAGGQDGWVTFAEGTNRWDTYYDMQEAVNEYIATISPIDAEDIPMGRIIKLDKLITILHTNDVHGRFPTDEYKGTPQGMTYLASYIKAERAKNPNTILLDAGDTFQGNAFAQYFRNATPNPIAGAMNLLDYDAMTIGNHEFNFGNETFATMLGQVDFPLLGANVEDDGRYGFINDNVQDYITMTVDGVDVAIFGLTNPEVPIYELPSNIEGLTFYPATPTAASLVPQIQAAEDPDLMIALTHIGYDVYKGSYDKDKFIAMQVPGIDVIIGGHSHTKLDPAVMITSTINPTGTLVAQTRAYAQYLGKINVGLVADGNGGYDVVMREGYLLPAADVEPDADLVAYLDPFVAELEAYTSTEIGQTTAPIDALEAYTQETTGANLQTDAAVWELTQHGIEVDFYLSGAMSNKKVADEATPENPVTLTVQDMYTLMPYENSLVVMRMNGPQIKAILERSYRNWWYYKYQADADPPYGGYSHYTTCMLDINAGGVITYDDRYPDPPDGNNVVSLVINGQEVDFTDADTYYNVGTVNYLAAGSCNFNDEGVTIWPLDQIVADTQYYVRDAVINYIMAMGTISPAIEGRLVFQ